MLRECSGNVVEASWKRRGSAVEAPCAIQAAHSLELAGLARAAHHERLRHEARVDLR